MTSLAGFAVKPLTAPNLTVGVPATSASVEPTGYDIFSELKENEPATPVEQTFTRPSVLVPFETVAWI